MMRSLGLFVAFLLLGVSGLSLSAESYVAEYSVSKELAQTDTRPAQTLTLRIAVSDEDIANNLLLSQDDSGRCYVPADTVKRFHIQGISGSRVNFAELAQGKAQSYTNTAVVLSDKGKTKSYFLFPNIDPMSAPVRDNRLYVDEMELCLAPLGVSNETPPPTRVLDKLVFITLRELEESGLSYKWMEGKPGKGKVALSIKRANHESKQIPSGKNPSKVVTSKRPKPAAFSINSTLLASLRSAAHQYGILVNDTSEYSAMLRDYKGRKFGTVVLSTVRENDRDYMVSPFVSFFRYNSGRWAANTYYSKRGVDGAASDTATIAKAWGVPKKVLDTWMSTQLPACLAGP